MRIGSSSIGQNKPISKKNYSKGLELNRFKNFNKNIVDNFNFLNGWDPVVGTWSTTNNVLTTSSNASTHPILLSYDLRAQNISATMSLDSAGAGIVFWFQDINNWYAATTFYTSGSETVSNGTSTSTTHTWYTGYWSITGPTGCSSSIPYHSCPKDINGNSCGCWPSGGTNSSTTVTCNNGTRTRFDFFIRILRNVNGTISQFGNPILVRSTRNISFVGSTCSSGGIISTADNINGIELTTSGENLTIRARNDSNTFYADILSTSVPGATRGTRSGIIFSPGGNYLLSSAVSNISIVEN